MADFQRFQSDAVSEGKISQWDDGRGFGWVEGGGKRVFVHIKDFNRGQRRPRTGEQVRFVAGTDALHLAELLGGWPGAFAAQRRLRHKCSKGSYQLMFFGIVVLFQLAAADLITGHRMGRWALEWLGRVISEQW